MKKTIYILSLLLVLTACYEDNGNYDYASIHDINFTVDDPYITTVLGEVLYIPGKFETAEDPSNLTYTWYVTYWDGGSTPKADTLSTDKDFNELITLPPGIDREVIYSVYNKATDVHYSMEYYITIESFFSKGWAILKEIDGGTEVDFIAAADQQHYKDILANLMGLTMEGQPVGIDFAWDTYASIPFDHMNVTTTYDAYNIDLFTSSLKADLVEDHFTLYDFFTFPFISAGQGYPAWNGFSTNYAFFVDNAGKIFTSYGGGTLDNGTKSVSGNYGSPVEGEYKASNIILSTRGNAIFYDELQKRYLYVDFGQNPRTVAQMEADETDAFDPSTMDKTCIYLAMEDYYYGNTAYIYYNVEGQEITESRLTFAVAKDDANNYYIQRFMLDGNHTFHGKTELNVTSTYGEGLITENTAFAINAADEYTYIATGTDVHIYLKQSNVITQNAYTFAGYGSQITQMECDYAGDYLALVLDNTTLVIYDLNTNTVINSYLITGDVVELEYKEYTSEFM